MPLVMGPPTVDLTRTSSSPTQPGSAQPGTQQEPCQAIPSYLSADQATAPHPSCTPAPRAQAPGRRGQSVNTGRTSAPLGAHTPTEGREGPQESGQRGASKGSSNRLQRHGDA